MDEERIFRKLVSAMGDEHPSEIDVVDRVMDNVMDLEPPSPRVMWIMTATAAAAAIIVAALAIQSIPDQSDPITQFMGGAI